MQEVRPPWRAIIRYESIGIAISLLLFLLFTTNSSAEDYDSLQFTLFAPPFMTFGLLLWRHPLYFAKRLGNRTWTGKFKTVREQAGSDKKAIQEVRNISIIITAIMSMAFLFSLGQYVLSFLS